jgi:hypothetical protein
VFQLQKIPDGRFASVHQLAPAPVIGKIADWFTGQVSFPPVRRILFTP